jgi:hypothetical protein
MSAARAKPPETEQQINEVCEDRQTRKQARFSDESVTLRNTRPHGLADRDNAIC